MIHEPDAVHALRDLADWQVMDADSHMIGKVDDLLFVARTDGDPVLTSILVGGVAYAKRFGGAWTRAFDFLSRRLGEHGEPLDLPVTLVERRASDLRVGAEREALGRYRGRADRPGELCLSDLVGAELIGAGDRPCGRVADLWLAGPAGSLADLRLHGLIVGGGAVGDRLGFERARGPVGPVGLRGLFAWLGRHTRFLPWHDVTVVEPRAVRTHRAPDELRPLSEVEPG
ncbi:MAG TPA: hypothetical protein VFC99_06515 [Acidimicrobiia bacterium]|nr:hypothetical protein [Acidimicrobiia bacterium]